MLMTVTNLTSSQLNYPDYYYGYPGTPPVYNAIGGNLVNPVPFPFDWVLFQPNGTGSNPGVPGTSYAVQLPVHTEDLGRVHPNFSPLPMQAQWNILVQAGTVSIAYASETDVRDFGDLFIVAI